jgi:hypothetical protein
LSVDLSPIYYFYSIDPRAVWKGQLALLLGAGAALAVMAKPLNPDSRGLRGLKRCGVVGIAVMVALQCVVLIRYLFYPSYLNHSEAAAAAVSWLGWEGYPLYPRSTPAMSMASHWPVLYQVTGFFLWLLGPSISASKILGLTAFSLSQVLSAVTLRRSGASAAEALTLTGVQCLVLAGFTDQGYVSGVRPDALLLLASQAAILVARSAPTMPTAGALGLFAEIFANLKIHTALYRSLYSAGLRLLSVSIALRDGEAATDVHGRAGSCYCVGCPFYSVQRLIAW